MSERRSRIIVASDRHDLVALAAPLQAEGFEVVVCGDGARVLELALARPPVLIVLETDLPLLPVDRLVQILRSNPRTERVAFCFVGREGEEVDGFLRRRDQFFVRPFNSEQVLGDILGYLHRIERTRQVSRQDREVEGALEQISLVDLLQIFSLNRKDGLLTLNSGGQVGTISLLGGLVANARLGQMQGEKAFFRLLGWNRGSFRFHPEVRESAPQISLPTDHLIMEGLRQQDELAARAGELPALEDELVLRVPREHLPEGLRPATSEILLLLQYYRRVRDILDHSSRPDLEVLQILQVLLDKGLVERAEPRDGDGRSDELLLALDEVIAIKEAFGEGDNLFETATVKLVLLPGSRADLDAFVRALQGVGEFVPDPVLLRFPGQIPLGDVGRICIDESFAIRLFCLTTDPQSLPLWRCFCRRQLGALAIGSGPGVQAAADFFRLKGRTPVIDVAGADQKTGALTLKAGDRAGLRQMLAALAEPYRRPVVLD
ncbi:MAG: response regulator [Deltaproteobacteria bacterium]|nr:MAG: response regulator [Deltaproteobacteria bacterium]